MKAGSIIFFKGNSVISKIIRLLDGEYSHIAVSLSGNVILEAQRFSDSRITKINTDDAYDIVELTLTEEQIDKLKTVSIDLLGYKYDYVQVFTTLFSIIFKTRRKNDRQRYICSEIVVELLYKIDYFTESEYNKAIDFTPNELHKFLLAKEKMIKVNDDEIWV